MQATVAGTNVSFDILGDGPRRVVFSEMGWNAAGAVNGRPLAGDEWSVLTWDRPNTGKSAPYVPDLPSEYHAWSHVLGGLLTHLGWDSVGLVGGSSGAVLSLLVAAQTPRLVSSAVLIQVPDDTASLWAQVSRQRYLNLGDAAMRGGMPEVVDFSLRQHDDLDPPKGSEKHRMRSVYRCLGDPANRELVLGIRPREFAERMQRWGKWFASSRFPYANLTDDQLRGIHVPCGLIPGERGSPHPPHTVEHLRRMLPATRVHAADPRADWLSGNVSFIHDFLRAA